MLIIRNLDDDVLARLRAQATAHGRTIEAEIGAILVAAVGDPCDSSNLFAALLDRLSDTGGVELELPPRSTAETRDELWPTSEESPGPAVG